MTANDLYISYGDALLPLSDIGGPAKPLTSMLAQLLTKAASNEKKFVVEEAQRAMLVSPEQSTAGSEAGKAEKREGRAERVGLGKLAVACERRQGGEAGFEERGTKKGERALPISGVGTGVEREGERQA